jgi:hypothetical protein
VEGLAEAIIKEDEEKRKEELVSVERKWIWVWVWSSRNRRVGECQGPRVWRWLKRSRQGGLGYIARGGEEASCERRLMCRGQMMRGWVTDGGESELS